MSRDCITWEQVFCALDSHDITELAAILSASDEMLRQLLTGDSNELQTMFGDLCSKYKETDFDFLIPFLGRLQSRAAIVRDEAAYEFLKGRIHDVVSWLRDQGLNVEPLMACVQDDPEFQNPKETLDRYREEQFFYRADLRIADLLASVKDLKDRKDLFLRLAERHCPPTLVEMGSLIMGDGERSVDPSFRPDFLTRLARRWPEISQWDDVMNSRQFWELMECLLKSFEPNAETSRDLHTLFSDLFRWICDNYFESSVELREVWGSCFYYIMRVGALVPEIFDGMFRDGGCDAFCRLGRPLIDEFDDESIAFFFYGMEALTHVQGDRATTIRVIFGTLFDKLQVQRDDLSARYPNLDSTFWTIYSFWQG